MHFLFIEAKNYLTKSGQISANKLQFNYVYSMIMLISQIFKPSTY